MSLIDRDIAALRRFAASRELEGDREACNRAASAIDQLMQIDDYEKMFAMTAEKAWDRSNLFSEAILSGSTKLPAASGVTLHDAFVAGYKAANTKP